jgi:hypothetical protein
MFLSPVEMGSSGFQKDGFHLQTSVTQRTPPSAPSVYAHRDHARVGDAA